MLKQRIITALVLAPITLACIFLLPTHYFILFASAIILIGAWEWGPLMGVNSTGGRIGFMVFVLALMAGLHVLSPADSMWQSAADGGLQLDMTYYGILAVSALWCVFINTILSCFLCSLRNIPTPAIIGTDI